MFLDDGWIASYNHIIGNVFHDYTSCGHDASAAYLHSRANRDIASEPCVVAYSDWPTSFHSLPSFDWVVRMVGCEEETSRAYLDITPYLDTASIEEIASEINNTPLAYFDSIPMVAMERRNHKCGWMGMRKEFELASMEFVHIPSPTLIELSHGIVGSENVLLHFGVGIVVLLISQHFLVFCHIVVILCRVRHICCKRLFG